MGRQFLPDAILQTSGRFSQSARCLLTFSRIPYGKVRDLLTRREMAQCSLPQGAKNNRCQQNQKDEFDPLFCAQRADYLL